MEPSHSKDPFTVVGHLPFLPEDGGIEGVVMLWPLSGVTTISVYQVRCAMKYMMKKQTT